MIVLAVAQPDSGRVGKDASIREDQHAERALRRGLVPVSLQASDTSVTGLPLTEVRASGHGRRWALLLTGDGGWVAVDRALADTLAAHDIAVVGFNSPSYLSHKRTPEETAAAVARVMRHYVAAWHRDEIVLIGYSRGADMAPFVLNRLPAPLRDRIVFTALIGLGDRGSFEFHLEDLVRDVHRASDIPMRPELSRLRGAPMLCVYGRDEKDSLCPALDSAGARTLVHPGTHKVSASDVPAIARAILAALRPDSLMHHGVRRVDGADRAR